MIFKDCSADINIEYVHAVIIFSFQSSEDVRVRCFLFLLGSANHCFYKNDLGQI